MGMVDSTWGAFGKQYGINNGNTWGTIKKPHMNNMESNLGTLLGTYFWMGTQMNINWQHMNWKKKLHPPPPPTPLINLQVQPNALHIPQKASPLWHDSSKSDGIWKGTLLFMEFPWFITSRNLLFTPKSTNMHLAFFYMQAEMPKSLF